MAFTNKRHTIEEVCIRRNLLASNAGIDPHVVLEYDSIGNKKKLHPYQVCNVKNVLANKASISVLPPGSGKSLIKLSAAAKLVKLGHKVIVVTSRLSIIASSLIKYTKDSPVTFCFGNDEKLCTLPKWSISSLNDDKVSKLKRAIKDKTDKTIICVHYMSFVQAINNMSPSEYEGIVFLFDEAHHSGYDRLHGEVSGGTLVGKTIDILLKADNCQVHMFTASDFRADGLPMSQQDLPTYRRSLLEHYRGGYCPDLNIYAIAYDTVNLKQYCELDNSDSLDSRYLGSTNKLIDAYVETLHKQRERGICKQTLMSLPSQMRKKGGKPISCRHISYQLEKSLRKQFGEDLNILNLASRDGKHLVSSTSWARKEYQRLEDEHFDVVISIAVMNEGVDWVNCCQIFEPRIPGSMLTIIQRSIGRGLRNKPHNHKFRNVTDVYFFELRLAEKDSKLFCRPLFNMSVRLAALFNGRMFSEQYFLRFPTNHRKKINEEIEQAWLYPNINKIIEGLLRGIATGMSSRHAIVELSKNINISLESATEILLPYLYVEKHEGEKKNNPSLKNVFRGKIFNGNQDFKDFLDLPEIKALLERMKIKDMCNWYSFLSSNDCMQSVERAILAQEKCYPDIKTNMEVTKEINASIGYKVKKEVDYDKLRKIDKKLIHKPERLEGFPGWKIYLGLKTPEDYCRGGKLKKYCDCGRPGCKLNKPVKVAKKAEWPLLDCEEDWVLKRIEEEKK